MDIKHNKSTFLRPEGDRTLDAPLVSIDIPKIVNQITSEDSWFKNDRNAITVFKTTGYRIVVVALKANAEMTTDSENLVNGIITFNVLQGSLALSANNEMRQLGSGCVAVLHENLSYQITTTETCIFLMCVSGENP